MTSRIALVTGAGSGIGRAAALALVDAGWTVAVTGRRQEQLEETAELAGDARARVLPLAGDVGNPVDVDRIFAAADARPSAGSTCCSTTPAPAPRRSRSRT